MSKTEQKSRLNLIGKIAENRWFAFSTIALLQLKVMYRIWDFRDLTPGDASEYFLKAFSWLDDGAIDLLWSPVYTMFIGSLYRFVDDPFRVTMIAQVSIALCASLLVLALMRCLLPHSIAWFIAVWWTLLPINYDTVYNVHLFSALFPLAICLVAARRNDLYGRGIVLGGLLFSAVLVRSEYGALFFIWLFAVAGYEVFLRKRGDTSATFTRLARAYGIPVVIALVLIGFFYSRAAPGYPEILEHIKGKSTLYVCQNYAYNRKQQGDSWHGDPWTECQALIERDFGKSAVTFPEAFILNPGKIFQHITWNLRLIPSGTQLALFDRYAGGPNPDFMRADESKWVWIPFILVICLSSYGAWRGFLQPLLKNKQASRNLSAWLLLFCSALFVFGIMLMVRPRPSYMFPYTIFIMALTGLGLACLVERLNLNRTVRAGVVPIAILLVLLAPSHYDTGYTSHFGYTGQNWRETYERIAPHIDRGDAATPSTVIIPAGNYQALCNYLGVDCIKSDKPAETLNERVDGTRSYVLYLEDMLWSYSTGGSGPNNLPGYVMLHCSSMAGKLMSCSDGTIDLERGVMNDGRTDIPLRATLFVNNGFVVERKSYQASGGYWLQVLMRNNRIDRILVLDLGLFQSDFNQQFLLGNFDRRRFTDVYNNSPLARILMASE